MKTKSNTPTTKKHSKFKVGNKVKVFSGNYGKNFINVKGRITRLEWDKEDEQFKFDVALNNGYEMWNHCIDDWTVKKVFL